MVSYSALHKLEMLKFKVLQYKPLKTQSSAQYKSYVHNFFCEKGFLGYACHSIRQFVVHFAFLSSNTVCYNNGYKLGLVLCSIPNSFSTPLSHLSHSPA